jgi:hypothetical protein
MHNYYTDRSILRQLSEHFNHWASEFNSLPTKKETGFAIKSSRMKTVQATQRALVPKIRSLGL